MKEMYMKNKMKAIVSIVVALAFVMPITAVANFGTIGVTSDSEIISDIENRVEISSNSDNNDNIETNNDLDTEDTTTEKTIDAISSTGTTIYVDDDAEPPYGGTPEHPYRYIQQGIDNATVGDTIYVLNGLYYENVIVNKTLDLVGESESRENVIVDGNGIGTVVLIEADSVTISGFMIQNSGNYWEDMGIDIQSDYSTIHGNIINNNWRGIYIDYEASYNKISENNITSNSDFGICGGGSNNNLSGNTISNNLDGICSYGPFNYNTISENIIKNNDRYGIGLKGTCNNNNITSNTFKENSIGIELYDGPTNTMISGNTFTNNRWNSISMHSPNNIISDNNYANNSIELSTSSITIIDNNFISSGIFILGEDLSTWNSHIMENNVANENPIRYYKNTNNLVVPQDTAQVILANCSSFTIKNLNLLNLGDIGGYSIQIGFSNYNNVSKNLLDGVHLCRSSNNMIFENNLSGIWISSMSYGNKISENIVREVGEVEIDGPGNLISRNVISDGGSIRIFDSNNVISGNILINGGLIHLHGLYGPCEGNTVSGNIVMNSSGSGILLQQASDNMVSGNNISKCIRHGIELNKCPGNIVSGNIVTDNTLRGVEICRSSDNIICGNIISNNCGDGLRMRQSDNNFVYHNDFINNSPNARDGCSNTWDVGYPYGGNYWDDYEDVDEYSGPNQDVPGPDGIGDTPYNILDGSNQDRYPFMNRDGWLPKITDVTFTVSDPLDTNSPFGWENVTCTVIGNGVGVKDVKLIVTNPNTITEEYPMINIPSTDTYYYNTTLTVAREYTYHIWADDTSGNNATSLPKQFELPPNWDVDMNGQTHFSDLMDVIRMYGVHGPDGWVREDVDNNGQVHFSDLMDIIRHYGEQWK